MIDLQKNAEAILQRALVNGGELAEIYYEERSLTSIVLEDRKVEKIVSGSEIGAGIRVLCGERTLYAHTNDVTLNGLQRAAETVAGGVSAPKSAYSFDFEPQRLGISVQQSAQSVLTPEKLDLIRAADAAARAVDSRIVQVAVHYADSVRRVVIVNSDGRYVEDSRPQTLLTVQAVGANDGIIQTGYHPVGGTLGFELFDREDPEEVGRIAARQACLMLDAEPAPAGRMPVVLSAEAGGTMIHEAVGHGLEADHIDKQMSKYCGRLHEMIAVPEVTVVDDGTVPQRRGTGCVDDEGTPTQRTVLIDHGRLVRFINDLRTARKMGHSPTGNGRRESYQHKPIPRMTNTMLLSGNADPKDILASAERGLFVRKMGGGQVNTLNGDFVFEVNEGYLIRNGKAETPVRGATLIGNGPDALMNVEAVGNDLGFGLGTCGKDGQGVPVSDAQPTIRIRELTVGGTAR
ncbi:MAG: TldD/PmbA family protein [Candidatus Hydrogenedentes bacterium]|nr:TldD/PmbA family protein [Candidatus Hydrogenedentota bacterium]